MSLRNSVSCSTVSGWWALRSALKSSCILTFKTVNNFDHLRPALYNFLCLMSCFFWEWSVARAPFRSDWFWLLVFKLCLCTPIVYELKLLHTSFNCLHRQMVTTLNCHAEVPGLGSWIERNIFLYFSCDFGCNLWLSRITFKAPQCMVSPVLALLVCALFMYTCLFCTSDFIISSYIK